MNHFVCQQRECNIINPCVCIMDDGLIPLNCLYEPSNKQLWNKIAANAVVGVAAQRITAQGMKAAQKTICSCSGLQPLRKRCL